MALAADTAKAVKKAAAGDSLKTKTQMAPKNAPDDVWGVQSVDSTKTESGKKTVSQSSAIDTTVHKQAVDTAAAVKPAGVVGKDKKAGKQSVKKEKAAKKPKSPSPPSVDDKNW
jgi:hypothetical protein